MRVEKLWDATHGVPITSVEKGQLFQWNRTDYFLRCDGGAVEVETGVFIREENFPGLQCFVKKAKIVLEER